MIAVRSRLALELAIEPKKSKQIVGSGCKGMKPQRQQVEEVTDRWLVDLLQEEDWWIPRRRHSYVRLKLGSKAPPSPLFAAYTRDVYCWYPLHRWKMVGIQCPRCKKEGGIRPRQMTDCYNRTWKRVFTQDGGWYFVLSPRVQCRLCEKDLRGNGKTKREDNTDDQWSWSCTSNEIIQALPELNRLEFPAVLSRQQGIDRAYLDMMRALFNRKVRPKDLANIWLESSTIQYINSFITSELKARNRLAVGRQPLVMMSDYGDPEGYGGKAPSGRYLSTLYLDHHKEVRPHMEQFIKRRPLGDIISLDVSYKAGRHVMRHKGKRQKTKDHIIYQCTSVSPITIPLS